MKPISIHPLSAVLGAAVLGLVALATSAQRTSEFLGHGSHPDEIRVLGIPDPRTAVLIREGTPYTVPSGKLLIVTAVGMTNAPSTENRSVLRLDGKEEVTTFLTTAAGGSSLVEFPSPGIRAVSGQVVEADTLSSGNDGRAWGYLIDA